MRTLPVRLDEPTIDRLDRLAEVLTARAAGAETSRSAVMRISIIRGIQSLEAEFMNATAERQTPKKKKAKKQP